MNITTHIVSNNIIRKLKKPKGTTIKILYLVFQIQVKRLYSYIIQHMKQN